MMINRQDPPHTQIQCLLAAHPYHGDRGEIDAMIDLYVPDGTYELPNGAQLKGTDQMREMLSGSSSRSTDDGWGLLYMRHHLTTSHVEFVSDELARSDAYFLNVNNRGLDHWGRWQDTFRGRSDGSWLYQSRKVIVEGTVYGSWFSTASGLA